MDALDRKILSNIAKQIIATTTVYDPDAAHRIEFADALLDKTKEPS